MAETSRVYFDKLEVKKQLPGTVVCATGTIALDGGGATVVDCLATHGITTITNAVASIYRATTTLGDDLAQLTVSWATSNLSIWPNEFATTTDSTMQLSTDTSTVSYTVWGTV